MHVNKRYLNHIKTSDEVSKELKEGLKLLNKVRKPMVTFFGAHIVKKKDLRYQDCLACAQQLGQKGYAVLTGGGPGFMEAANKGAMTVGAPSLGLKANLIKGEETDAKDFTHVMAFKYMFVRRFILSIKSKALVFYPGGYGTLNELYEFIVLMQTGLVDTVPIICVDKEFWKGMMTWLEGRVLEDRFISKKDLKLIKIVDNADEVVKLIK